MHSAMWSKPIAKASSIVSVPPKRTPPNMANSLAPLQQQPDQFQEILVPAHGDAVFGDAAEAGHHAVVEVLESAMSRDRRGPARAPAIEVRQRLDLQPVDADHGVAVVHQVVRQREAGRAEPDHQHLAAAVAAAAAGGGC